MEDRVNEVLARIRPGLSGVDVTLLNVDDGVVRVKVLSATCGPTMSKELLLEVLEDQLKEELPEVKEVIAED